MSIRLKAETVGICFAMLFVSQAFALDNVQRFPGYLKHTQPIDESFDFDGDRFVQQRTVIEIPANYGKLLSIVSGGLGVVFWFEDSQGRLRNVTMAASEPLIIERKGSARIATY